MARLPKIGEKKIVAPAAFEVGLPEGYPKKVSGTVVYVHPKGRFYQVEVKINRQAWRETLYPEI